VRYLAQALGRGQGPAVARPAMRTGSPLAEADQRLHLDAFAARLDAPLAGRATAVADELAPDPFEAEAADALEDAPLRSLARRGRARRAEALVLGQPSRSSSASPPPPASTSHAVVPPPVAAAQRRPGTAEPALSFTASPPSPGRTPAPRAATPETPAPVPERSRPRDAVAPELDRAPAPLPRIDSSGARATPSLTTPATTPEPQARDAISQALAKVSTWLDRPVPPVEPAPVVVAASPAREHEVPASVARREPQRAFVEPVGPARPRLEIGSIEVEVVTPERPRRAPAPARTPGPSAGSLAPVFGWRQR
jgi:hypothetical protein